MRCIDRGVATSNLHIIIRISLPAEYGYGCEEGDVRLEDGYHNSSGRVEFCHGGEWGTVCNNSFGSDDARVVCRQLGLPTNGG